MNWKRGLFRLWIAASAIWLILVALGFEFPAAVWTLVDPTYDLPLATIGASSTDATGSNSKVDDVGSDTPLPYMSQDHAIMIVKATAGAGIGVPILIGAIGWCLIRLGLWVRRGFKVPPFGP